MRLLSTSAATYLANGFAAGPAQRIDDIVSQAGRKPISEASTLYVSYRDNLLREAERDYYFAVSCYRRAHDSLMASSAFWAHVALYYSNWFAARCVLGVLGGWADTRRIVEVVRETPGTQEFRILSNPFRNLGPHKSFWHVYYSSVTPLRLLIDPALFVAVEPVSLSPTWQIDTRNRVNYIVTEAQKLTDLFAGTFDATRFPSSLPGESATQYDITHATLHLAAKLITDLGVKTDAYGSRGNSVKRDIFDQPVPELFAPSDVAALAV